MDKLSPGSTLGGQPGAAGDGAGTSMSLSTGRLQPSSLDSWTGSFDAKVLNWEMLFAQIPPNQLPQWHAGFTVGPTQVGDVAYSAKIYICLGIRCRTELIQVCSLEAG